MSDAHGSSGAPLPGCIGPRRVGSDPPGRGGKKPIGMSIMSLVGVDEHLNGSRSSPQQLKHGLKEQELAVASHFEAPHSPRHPFGLLATVPLHVSRRAHQAQAPTGVVVT